MNIKPFAVEEWMNEYEVGALYNIAETCVDSVSLDELFELTGENKEDFLKDFCAQRLTYGDIWGSEALRSGISKLYHTIKADEVVLTHGAAGANHHVFCSLISVGDRVVSIMPTYQQLYSIPEAIGADVAIMHLKQENDYLPNLDELRALLCEHVSAELADEWLAEDERQFQLLWKNYFRALAIPQRINERQQRRMMPRRYWKHLTEME